MTSVNARLLADTIYCEETEFSYTSRAPNITVPFAVIWGGSKPLDNPQNIHLVIYRCRDMADNCGMCLTLAPKYECGWCQSTDRCEVKDNCEGDIGMWLNSTQTCPNPEIHSFEPVMGPWEGNTNVTIRGINLGQTFKVRGIVSNCVRFVLRKINRIAAVPVISVHRSTGQFRLGKIESRVIGSYWDSRYGLLNDVSIT